MVKESVIYQDIWQKGRHHKALKIVMGLLKQRFSEIDSSIIERVRVLSVEQLESLGMALFDILELADIVAWLEQQESNTAKYE